MMDSVKLVSALLLVILSIFSSPASAFDGDFEITGLEIDAPFEADPSSTRNTSLSFVFNDQNTPKDPPATCYLTWAVGLAPPSKYIRGVCSDNNVHAWLPDGTFNGVGDFQLEISHSYQDDSLGPPPWNVNTLFGFLNLTIDKGGAVTEGYTCDVAKATCRSEPGAVLIATVRFAVA